MPLQPDNDWGLYNPADSTGRLRISCVLLVTGAEPIIRIPAFSGLDTLPVIGQPQTWSAINTFSGGVVCSGGVTVDTSSSGISIGSHAAINDMDQGTYTPTLTNAANLAASTAFQCQFLRVGRTVTVGGRVDVDPTLAATATQLGISLPVASNFGATEDCGGCAFASGIAAQGAGIRADAANDRAEMVWISGDITNQPMYFTFTYQVI